MNSSFDHTGKGSGWLGRSRQLCSGGIIICPTKVFNPHPPKKKKNLAGPWKRWAESLVQIRNQIVSLVGVVIKNRRALDLLTAGQGEVAYISGKNVPFMLIYPSKYNKMSKTSQELKQLKIPLCFLRSRHLIWSLLQLLADVERRDVERSWYIKGAGILICLRQHLAIHKGSGR